MVHFQKELKGFCKNLAKSISEKNLRYYYHNKSLIYSLLYLPASLALEIMLYFIFSMGLNPMTDCLYKNVAKSIIRHKTLSD